MSVHGESIALIGMPGAGKSTVGVLLAKELARDFIDTDLLIQLRENKTLQDIILQSDYHQLRHVEHEVLQSLEADKHVIATGGSAVYSEAGMQRLAALGQVIYLYCPRQTLEGRIHNMASRGIAKPDEQSFESLFAERDPLYRRYADIVIDCSSKTPEQVVSEVIYSEAEQYADMDA